MYWAFVKKCRFPDGKVDYYAHMVLADTETQAQKHLRETFSLRNVCGEITKQSRLAVLEEILTLGSSDSPSDLYEKACKKAQALTQKEGTRSPLP
jgi:hypothetical protein